MYFYFNNNSSESFKVILSDFPELPFVQEEIKTVEVGGRDGTLTKRTGKYKDLLISLECELLDIENYNEAIRNINTEFRLSFQIFTGRDSSEGTTETTL